MKSLVTGGAGYVGSHMVKTLLDAGHDVVVVDDLSEGHRDAVPAKVPFVQANIGSKADMLAVLREHRIEAVLNFAARSRVEESMREPRLYWQGNAVATLALLEAIFEVGGITPAFVQSSTAAVYGTPEHVPIEEDHPKNPVNAYGATKLTIERALEDYGRAYGLRWAALRYFNAAGAEPQAGLGERHHPETHLIPIVLDVAAGKRPHVSIYGTSWPTPDGTCVRDYVHVSDLCEAHLAALEYLANGGDSGAFNLGTGSGHSVRAIVEVARAVTGQRIATVDAPIRAGDPAVLVAKVDRAERVLGWRAKRTELSRIISDAWTWKQRAEQG